MTKITHEMAKQAYIVAPKVHNNEIDMKSGKKIIYDNSGMTEGSAEYYIRNIRCLMNGQKYVHYMNVDDTEYFLTQILNDHGENSFKKALCAVKQHIEFKKSRNKSSNVEKLYKELIKKHNIEDATLINVSEEDNIEEPKDSNMEQ